MRHLLLLVTLIALSSQICFAKHHKKHRGNHATKHYHAYLVRYDDDQMYQCVTEYSYKGRHNRATVEYCTAP